MPDVDRTDHLLDPRRQPAGVQRQPDDRARHARAAARDPRARRQGRRRRPAPHAHRRARPTSTCSSARARDALLLVALVHVLFEEGLADPGALAEHVAASTTCASSPPPSRPRRSPPRAGSRRRRSARMARELARAPTRRRLRAHRHLHAGVRHARELAGRRDQRAHRQPRPAGRRDVPAPGRRLVEHGAATPGRGRGAQFGRWQQPRARPARGLRRAAGACLAEEIETPGEGQIRALITVAGNPVLSHAERRAPGGALETLDFMVSVDIYLNETTRHADVILPGAVAAGALALRPRASTSFAVRNVANYSPPVLEPDPAMPGRVGDRCCAWPAIVAGQGPDADVDGDRRSGRGARRARAATAGSRSSAATDELLAALEPRARARADARPDAARRPYGDVRRRLDGLTLADARGRAARHRPRPAASRGMPEVLRTPSGKIELAPEPLVADVARLRRRARPTPATAAWCSIGRRQLRSNNSWMHNLPTLVKGKRALHAARPPRRRRAPRAGRRRGRRACARATGAIVVPVEVTDA